MVSSKLILTQVAVFATVVLCINTAAGQLSTRCVCFKPDTRNGRSGRCTTRGCSAGYNNCYQGGNNVVFSFDFDSAIHDYVNDIDGCNCPGSNYAGGYGPNLVNGGHNATPHYSYNDCVGFGANSNLDRSLVPGAIDCCNYCCNRDDTTTTTTTTTTTPTTTTTNTLPTPGSDFPAGD